MSFELKTKHDIERYTPELRDRVINHNCRRKSLSALEEAINLLEVVEVRLTTACQYGHCETVEWTANKLGDEHENLLKLLRTEGYDTQVAVWREDLAIESADYKHETLSA
jgi:hypothetical protein